MRWSGTRHLAQPADRHAECAGNTCRSQLARGGFLGVFHQVIPFILGSDRRLDIDQRNVALQLDGKALVVTAQALTRLPKLFHTEPILIFFL